ncbi:hypothetical protein ACFLRC_04365, partial [Candidatus Altiarchaeota archaeon]
LSDGDSYSYSGEYTAASEGEDSTPPIATLNSPSDDNISYDSQILFNCSATDETQLANISLWGNFTGTWSLNETTDVSGASNSTVFNKTLTDGIYSWSCEAYDEGNNSDFAENRTLNVSASADLLPPTIDLVSPADQTVLLPGNVSFVYNVSDQSTIENCSLWTNLTGAWELNTSSSSITNASLNNFSVENLPDGEFVWNIECWDNETYSGFATANYTLYLNTEPQLTEANLTPTTGEITTQFNFSVVYTDADDEPPSSINVSIDGTGYGMSEADVGDIIYTDGKTYFYNTTLSPGSHLYRFQASDGINTTQTINYMGPDVFAAPILISPEDDEVIFDQASFNLTYNVSNNSGFANCSLWTNFTGVWGTTAFDDNISEEETNNFTVSPENGTFKWTVSCDEQSGGQTRYAENRTFHLNPQQGILVPYVILDGSRIEVGQNVTFNFTGGVRCLGGVCGNVTLILDPPLENFSDYVDEFKSSYGNLWKIVKENNRVKALGYGLSPDGVENVSTDSQLDEVTRTFLGQNSKVFGTDIADLETIRIDTDNLPNNDISQYLYYKQYYEGIPVYGSYVLAAYKNGKIVQVKSKFFEGIEIDTSYVVSLEEATEIARQEEGIPGNIVPLKAELIVFPVRVGDGTEHIFSWEILFPMSAETGGSWIFIIDADTGDVVRYWDSAVSQVSGTVTGSIYPALASDDLVNVNFENEHVYIKQGSNTLGNSTTNLTGGYIVDGISGNVDVFSQLKGPYVQVMQGNYTTPGVNYTQAITAPGTQNWNWSDYDTSTDFEESNMFYHINQIRQFYNGEDPLDIPQMDFMMNATVGGECNGEVCNAFYMNPEQGLCFGEGDGVNCDNLALYSDVIYHEYTHGVVDQIYNTSDENLPYIDESGAMNEAWADYFACTINNNSVMAEGALTSSRDLNNTNRFLDDWVNEVHVDSVMMSGALWDMRAALGKDTTNALVMGAMKQLPTSFSEELDDILISDDDNANLADGTPNIDEICQAFYDNHDISSTYCINHTLRDLYNVSFIEYYDWPWDVFGLTGTYATKYTPSSYPVNITKFMGVFFIYDLDYLEYRVHIYDDNNGEPGTELISPVTGTLSYAYIGDPAYVGTVNLSTQINSGSFWVGVELYDVNGPDFWYSNTSDSTSKYNGGSSWENLSVDPFMKVGVMEYMAPAQTTTTSTSSSTSTSTSSTTSSIPVKSVVPMDSGVPFYTTSQNPVYAANLSCLEDMREGETCNFTWTVNATGPVGVNYTFYIIVNSTLVQVTQNQSENTTISILAIDHWRIISEGNISLFVEDGEGSAVNNADVVISSGWGTSSGNTDVGGAANLEAISSITYSNGSQESPTYTINASKYVFSNSTSQAFENSTNATILLPLTSLINKFLPNSNESNDWVELFNTRSVTQNLSGWILGHMNPAENYTLLDNDTVSAEDTLGVNQTRLG